MLLTAQYFGAIAWDSTPRPASLRKPQPISKKILNKVILDAVPAHAAKSKTDCCWLSGEVQSDAPIRSSPSADRAARSAKPRPQRAAQPNPALSHHVPDTRCFAPLRAIPNSGSDLNKMPLAAPGRCPLPPNRAVQVALAPTPRRVAPVCAQNPPSPTQPFAAHSFCILAQAAVRSVRAQLA